jgi:outer membrane protein assembly factor BamB
MRKELAVLMSVCLLAAQLRGQPQPPASGLLDAVGKGDVAAVTALLDRGADVNASNDQGLTPLFVAADRANVALVRLLLARGADPERTQELMWGKTALAIASVGTSGVRDDRARSELVALLVGRGAGSRGEALPDLVRGGHTDAVQAIVERGRVSPPYLNQALASAKRAGRTDLVGMLVKAGALDPGPLDLPHSQERLQALSGTYRSSSGAQIILDAAQEGVLLLERPGRPRIMLFPVDLTLLKSDDRTVIVTLNPEPVPPSEITVREGGRSDVFQHAGAVPTRTTDASGSAGRSGSPAAATDRAVSRAASRGEWPSFRGPGGSGVGDGAGLPIAWNLEKGTNIQWRTPISGLAHSSPVIWGDRVFVTTAVPMTETTSVFRHGEGAGVASTRDDVPHSWRVSALDRQTGKVLWERVAHEGVPRTQRHVMASQANQTPATDGRHLVVFFGSEGLYCYDLDGKLLWQRDLGVLRANRLLDASYEWNTASSPIIYKKLVILQLDLMEGSYIGAFDIDSGKDVWRTTRDEIPSWATPLLYDGGPRPQIVTAAGKFARGYDPDTGKELWRLGKHSEFPTPTPIAGDGLIFVTSGTGSTVQPIYAIRPDATGDITLGDGEQSNKYVVWSKLRGGPSIPTPIVYGGLLYVCSATGILAAYDAQTGERIYQERLTRGGSYSASPVASDGRLYFASEDGDVIVVEAGRTFEKLAQNAMGELMMATPAIAPHMLVVRLQHQVVGISDRTPTTASSR